MAENQEQMTDHELKDCKMCKKSYVTITEDSPGLCCQCAGEVDSWMRDVLGDNVDPLPGSALLITEEEKS